MKKGIWLAVCAYGCWGFFPIYFRLLDGVPPLEITAHRVFWSCVTVATFLLLRGEVKQTAIALKNRQTFLLYTAAAITIAVNWLVYVWAVDAKRVVDASLGYYINPLFSVLLGFLVLKERVRRIQWLPIGLIACAVLFLSLVYGEFPWIALVLAAAFGTYGLVKKVAPLSSAQGLLIETAMLGLPALVYLINLACNGSGSFGSGGLGISLLLAVSGAVTLLPLLLFAAALKHAPLSVVGLIQYLTPTMQFCVGAILFHEPLAQAKLIGFAFVWVGITIYAAEAYRYTQNRSTLHQ